MPKQSSRTLPSLDRSPKKNWVENVGGLPDFIDRIAKHIHYDSGLSISHSIAAAVNRCRVLAAKGNAKAIKAIAEWEAKKGLSKSRTAAKKAVKLSEGEEDLEIIDLGLLRNAKGNSATSRQSKGGKYDEAKHPRSPQNGTFTGKVDPSQLIAARTQVEGLITNLQVGQTLDLPDKLGWVRRDASGYFVQGPSGYSASVSNLSSAIQAAAIILAGRIASR